ncbi:MAG TPA: hypothetical protein V6C65_28705 [Allocoleopsis sp.]
MLKIELPLCKSNLTLSVQRKLEKDANAVVKQILTAISADRTQILKPTCDRHLQAKLLF